jgi:hypothetical protein
MKCDQRISAGIKSDGVLETESGFQLGVYPIAIIPLLAGNLASATSDAVGGIDQCGFDGKGYRLTHDLLPATLYPGDADFTFTTFTKQALVS